MTPVAAAADGDRTKTPDHPVGGMTAHRGHDGSLGPAKD
jgi:hypothetical protein